MEGLWRVGGRRTSNKKTFVKQRVFQVFQVQCFLKCQPANYNNFLIQRTPNFVKIKKLNLI